MRDPWTQSIALLDPEIAPQAVGPAWPKDRCRRVLLFSQAQRAPAPSTPMPPLAPTASNEELIDAIAHAGYVTPADLAVAMGVHRPQACERLRELKFVGHVDEDSGRWRVSASWLILRERCARGQQDDDKHL